MPDKIREAFDSNRESAAACKAWLRSDKGPRPFHIQSVAAAWTAGALWALDAAAARLEEMEQRRGGVDFREAADAVRALKGDGK